MESELRELIGKYGLKAVHKALEKEMKDTFTYLSGLYGGEKVEKVEKKTVKKNIVVEEVIEPVVEESVSEEVVDPSVKQVVIESVKKTVTNSNLNDITVIKNVNEKTEQVNYTDRPKFDKQEHIAAIEKKGVENRNKGINPESLLTKENLEKWLSEGMSYMRIAREKVGLPDKLVGDAAKKFKLKSDITKLKEQKTIEKINSLIA